MTKKKRGSAIQRRLIPSYIFLIIFALFSVFPLFWMLTAATNTTLEVAQGKLWFGSYALENFKNLVSSTNLWGSMRNSFVYATVQTVLALFVCSLAGYGFELYHDKGKDILFAILLMAMMIPGVATMIPLFTMMSKMKLLSTVWGFALPVISTPFRHLLSDLHAGDEGDLCSCSRYYFYEFLECIFVAAGCAQQEQCTDDAYSDCEPFQRIFR